MIDFSFYEAMFVSLVMVHPFIVGSPDLLVTQKLCRNEGLKELSRRRTMYKSRVVAPVTTIRKPSGCNGGSTQEFMIT